MLAEVHATGEYREFPHQAMLHDGMDDHRFAVCIAHRRAGKTVAMVNQLIRDLFRCEKRRPQVAYIAPTYAMAKKVAWAYFVDALKGIQGVHFRRHELTIEIGERTIYLLGADNPDRLRGMYLDAAVIDEAANCPDSLITSILMPALADRQGSLRLIGTVAGRDPFWRLYEKGQDDPEWFTANLKPDDTDMISPDELERLRRNMSEDEFRREFMNDPSASVQGAYYGRAFQALEDNGQLCSVPYDPALPVTAAMDLGIADSTSIWFAQLHRGGEIRVIDFVEYQSTSMIDILKEAQARHPVDRWIGPHDLTVREYSTGARRIDTAADLGVRFEVAPNLPVMDGIEAVRQALPRCWFDESKCRDGIDRLRLYRSEWDDKRRVLRRQPLHDWTSHAADAFRYLIVGTDGGRPQRVLDLGPMDYSKADGFL